ncbi:DsbA family protein [Sphingomonas rubra]|uniref:Protein-disulfide isomerase n=1 Tax=Sphingomonas rubra TaxID=634430 RepID=A0A1I5U7R5_9SPHN|nr:thioredoxin domain-containing protein [Sphingomonas rubra]SFP90666.1 Protein-disulfide isomerase [Sphingomonas rubra]
MRLPLLLATVFLLAGAAPARDWTQTVKPAPSGFFVVGNPAAKVKLAEWASYTCSHCGDFATQSAPVLKDRMIRKGSVSLEVRHLIRDPLDLAAVVVARCGAPRGFLARHTAIFAGQEAWMQKGAAFVQANAASLGKLPPPAAFRRIADAAGLTAIGRANGLSEPQVAACFADKAALDRVTALDRQVPADVQGTPTFFVNGTLVPNVDWAALEPILRARGAQ